MTESWRDLVDERARYSLLNAAGAVLAALVVVVDWGEGTGELVMNALLIVAVVLILYASFNLVTLDDEDA